MSFDQFAEAAEKAQEGMTRALDRANRDHTDWTDAALEFLRRYAKKHQTFTGWIVTAAAELDREFPTPTNPRAWGAVWKLAVKCEIVRATNVTRPHPKRHGCPAMVWESRVFEVAQ